MHVALVNQGDWSWLIGLPRNCLWIFIQNTQHYCYLLWRVGGGIWISC